MFYLRILALVSLVLVMSAPVQAEPYSQVNLTSSDVLQLAQNDPIVQCVLKCRAQNVTATAEACQIRCANARPRSGGDCMGTYKSCRRGCAKNDKQCLRSCKAGLTNCK
jgi:hypothetical protein